MAGPIKIQYPDGCYLSFNWVIDRVSAAKLVEAVVGAYMEGYRQVHLMLSSPGGLLVDVYYAVECLKALPLAIVTWNMSSVQSAANLIFSLGVERYAVPGSTFFFHQTGFEGVAGQRNSEVEIREQLGLIKTGDKRSAEMIAEQVGLPVKAVTAWQRGGRTLTDKEALAAGLVHRIGRPQILPTAFVRQISV